MFETFSAFLFGTSKVSFATVYPREDAAIRLAAAVKKKPHILTFIRETVFGNVRTDEVVLYCHRPFLMRWGRPVFRGKFSQSEGKTVLEGLFSIHWFLKAIFSVWIGIVSAVPFIAGYVGFIASRESGDSMILVPMTFIFGLLGALMTGILGVGALRLGRPLALRDQECISEVIKTSIGPDDT